jgi:hypothetical protein
MSRISQYPLDTNIEGNDKWIGTSVNNANATKNFSVDNVVEYINKSAGVESQNLRYTYQNVQGDDVRLASTISFATSLGDNVPFEDITEWIISAYSKQVKDVRTYYEAPLVGSTILITNAFNPSNWAIFRWDSVTEDIDDSNFYNIELTHIQSTGELVANQDYLIALLDAASDGSAYWGAITGTLSNQTDLQNALNAKQETLVSGTNIKTINSTTILGSGNIAVQSTLVSGTNIQSINSSSILTSGNINLQVPLVSGTNIKTVNSTTLLGSGDLAVQPTLVSGTNIKTINSTSLLGSGNIVINTPPSGVAGAIQFSNGSTFTSDASNLFWDDTNKRLGIGTNVPNATLTLNGTISGADSASALDINQTWNTTGSPTAIKLNVVNTASGTSAKLIDLQVGGVSRLSLWAGANGLQIVPSMTVTGNITSSSILFGQNIISNTTNPSASGGAFIFGNSITNTSSQKIISITPTYNQASGTASNTDIFVNRTTTLVGSGLQYLMDLQSNGVSRLNVNPSGSVGIGESSPTARLQVKGSGSTSATNSLLVQNSSALDILRLQDDGNVYIGNTTNNSNLNIVRRGISRIRLRNTELQDTGGPDGTEIMSVSGSFNADSDSYGGIKLLTQTNWLSSQLAFYTGGLSGSGTKQMTLRNDGSLVVSTSAHLPSAKLQVDSTTQGALLPRMTTTQRNAIVTPATGLIVYDTTLLSFYQYNGTSWTAVGGGGGSPSGVAGAIQFSNGSAFASDAAKLFWDDTNNYLGIGTNAPSTPLWVQGYGGDIVRIMSADGSRNTFFTNSGLLGVQVYPTATIHSAGSGTTSATSSLIAQNSTNTASFKVADDGVSTFTFGSGGKVVILGNVSGGDTLLEMRRVPSGNAGFIFRSDNSVNQTISATSGALNLETVNSNVNANIGTGSVQFLMEIRDMTAFNTGVEIRLGGLGASAARWVNFGWSASYGSIFQAVKNGSVPAVDTLSLNPFGGNVGIGNTLANSAAILDLTSTTQGFLLPRMTNAQVLAIVTPPNGLMVYNTTIDHMCIYQAGAWVKISHSPM